MDASDGYPQPVPRPPRQRGAAGKGVFHKASRILEERAAKEKLLFDALEPGAKLDAYRAARQAEAAAALQELGPASGEPAASEVSRRAPAVLAPLSTAQRGGATSRPQASSSRKASGSGNGIASGIVAAYGRPEQQQPQPQPPPPQQQPQQPSQQHQQQPQQPQSQPRSGGRNERVIRADSRRSNAGSKLKTVGHYVMQETIGEGTFGKVKRGMHSLTGETVAIKILEKSKIKTEADLRRVTREIKILKQAQHPNCIRLLEVIDTPQQIFLMTEFLNGGELFDYIVHKSRLPEPEAAGVFLQILNGVEYLHSIKVIHRDLKPENLLMQRARKDSAGFTVKVADFGLSNTCEGDCLLATACGSPCYAAPEMIAGKKYDGTKSDVWSLGVVLFALVCGFLPFEDQDTPTLYRKILNAKYDCPAFISGEARDLIKRILDTDPSTRPSVAQLRAHPWLLRHAAPEQAMATPSAAQTPASTALDPRVLALLEPLGISAEAVAKGHSEGLHNNATVSYYLFSERIRRVEQESGRPFVLSDAQVPKAQVQTQQRKKPAAASATPREQDPATATVTMPAAAATASELSTPTAAEQATLTASEPTPATACEPVPAAAAAAVAPAPHVAPHAGPTVATEPEPELDGPAAVAVDAGGSAHSAADEATSTPTAALSLSLSTERIAQPPSPLDGAGDIASVRGQEQEQQQQQQQQQQLQQQQQEQQHQQHEQHQLHQLDQEEQHQQHQQQRPTQTPEPGEQPASQERREGAEDDSSRASSASGARTCQSRKSEAHAEEKEEQEETKDGEAGNAGAKAEAQPRAPIPTRPAVAPLASKSIPVRPDRIRAVS